MKIYLLDIKREWDAWFDGTPYSQLPRKCQSLYKWAADNNADIVTNLCYFNFDTAANRKIDANNRTIQYLRIARYASDCGYGGGTNERLTLPNGDIVGGFTCGIKDGVIIEKSKSGATARNYLGYTTDGRLIIAQGNNLTKYGICRDVLAYVKKQGTDVKLLLEMDGGGSCGTYSARAKALYAPKKEGVNGRSVCSVLCLKYKGASILETLKVGSKGHSVELLQTMMGTLEADGVFGNGTKTAVKNVQKKLGLSADGVAGRYTLTRLGLRK